jgi:hypothetical protein
MAASNLAYARDGSTLGGSVAEDAAIVWAFYSVLHELPANAETHQSYEARGRRLARCLEELELTQDDLKRQARNLLTRLGQQLPRPMSAPSERGRDGYESVSCDGLPGTPAVTELTSRRRERQ